MIRKELALVLGDEKSLYVIVLIYTLFVGICSVSIPISIQSLVNIIPSTAMHYPLFLLCIVLFVLLGVSTVIYGLQKYVVEIFKRRIFVRISTLMVTRTLYFEKKSMQGNDPEQLSSRFFEIPNIQASLPSLLVGTFTAVVQMLSAVIVCSFYHPILLIFNIVLLAIVFWILRYHGSIAIKTAIKESTAKYQTASWISEVSRKYFYLKSSKAREYVSKKANTLLANYITARKKHFKHWFFQTICLLVVYAVGNVLLLLICGLLVLNERLTLGQFVATEVFFSYTFGHVLRLGGYLESFYKLTASCNKISTFYKIPLEDHTGKDSDFTMKSISITNVANPTVNSNMTSQNLNLQINLDGSYNSLVDFHERTKGFLLNLIMGWEETFHSQIKVDEKFFDEINLDKYRDKIAFIDSSNIVCANIKEYATSCNQSASQNKFEAIIKLVGLYDVIQSLPEKEYTQIVSSKYPLNKEELIRLKFAKALIEENKLLIIDYPIADAMLRENKELLNYILHDANLTVMHFTTTQKVIPQSHNIFKFDSSSQSIIKHHV